MNTLLIAHRGESFDAPENTLASINLAWERGADAVEIDVHLSKDNQVVVIHDANTKRVASINRKVKQQTLTELKKIDVGSWKNEKWKNEKIPTLREVLDTIQDGKKLIIEVKSTNKILPFLKEDIISSKLQPNQIEFISFSYSTVVKAKKMFPKNNVLYLVDLDYTWHTRLISPPVEKLIAKTKEANLDGVNAWAGNLLTKKFAENIKSAGLLLYTWTINDPKLAKQLVKWGIDGITTDRAQWLKSKL